MSPEQRRGPRLSSREIGAIALIVLVTVFIFENTAETEIRFLIPKVSVPLWVALLAAAVLGFLAGLFLGRRRRRND
jgi:uncharacterized integral membrane protein